MVTRWRARLAQVLQARGKISEAEELHEKLMQDNTLSSLSRSEYADCISRLHIHLYAKLHLTKSIYREGPHT